MSASLVCVRSEFHSRGGLLQSGLYSPQWHRSARLARQQFRAGLGRTVSRGPESDAFSPSIHPKKGLRPLVEAWDSMRSTVWQMVIAGSAQGGHLAELEDLVQKMNLSDRITFCGPLHGEAKDTAYASAQAFILPSFSEGLPTTVLEAWAHRLPVLMTAECNLPEGFTGGAALEISSEPAKLAQSMLQFDRISPSEQAAMGQRGRMLAEQQFNWDRIAREMVAVYRWVAGRDPAPVCACVVDRMCGSEWPLKPITIPAIASSETFKAQVRRTPKLGGLLR